MKLRTFLFLLLIFSGAFALDTSRCIDPRYQDFKLLEVKYLKCISALEIKFQTTWYRASLWLPGTSAEIAGYEMPLLPLKEGEFLAGENITAFVPFQFVPGTAEITIAGNASTEFICKTFSIDLNQVEQVDCSTLTVEASSEYDEINEKVKITVENGEAEILPTYVAFVKKIEGSEEKTSMVSSVTVPGGGASSAELDGIKPEDILNGKVYVYAEDNGRYFLKIFENYQFHSFSAQVPEKVSVMPGTGETFEITVKNTGTLLDCYSIAISLPSGWEYEEVPSFCLEPGEEKTLSIAFTPPEQLEGEVTGTVTVESQNSELKRIFTITFSPRPFLEYEIVQTLPKDLVESYRPTPIEAYLLGTATRPEPIAWVVTASPAIRVEKGYGLLVFSSGKINAVNSTFIPGVPCAVAEDAEEAYNAARKLLAVIEITKWFISNNEEVPDTLSAAIDEIKTSLMKDPTVKLYALPRAEQLEDIIEKYAGCEEQACIDDVKERVAFLELDYPVVLEKAGEKLFSDCTAVRAVKLCLEFLDGSNFEWKESCRNVSIEGSGVVGVDFPSEIRVISGKPKSVKLTLTNYGGDSLELEISSDFEWLSSRKYIYLPKDATKTTYVYFKVPEYFEAHGEEYHITIKGRGFTIEKPFKLYAGTLEIGGRLPQDILVTPGEEKDIEVTLATGTLDEEFILMVSRLPWVKVEPREVTARDGAIRFTLVINPPPESAEGSYIGYLAVIPKHFDRYGKKVKFTVVVSGEIQDVKAELERLKEKYEKYREKIPEDYRSKIEEYLGRAEEEISKNKITTAKYYVKTAENILNRALSKKRTTKKKKGFPTALLVLIVVVGGVLALPLLKERGMLPEPLIPVAEKIEGFFGRKPESAEAMEGIPEEVRMIERSGGP